MIVKSCLILWPCLLSYIVALHITILANAQLTFLKPVKDENNNAKNSTTLSNYIRNVPIEDAEIMVSFDVTSLCMNIALTDTLNIIKDYVNDDQFTRKTAIPQDGFFDLVNSEIFMQSYERTAISTALYSAKFGSNLSMAFILFLNVRTWKTFSITSTIFIKILSLPWRKKVMENQRFLKRNNGEISVLVYRKPTRTDQYLHYSSCHQTSKESVVSSLFNRAYFVVTNKDDLRKENTRRKQVLKENGYQESITSKTFRIITNNHSLPQSQQRKPQIPKKKRSQ